MDNINESRQPQMLRETIPFIILATLTVVGRFLSRRCRQAPLGADDLAILLALVRIPLSTTCMLLAQVDKLSQIPTWGDFAIVMIGQTIRSNSWD